MAELLYRIGETLGIYEGRLEEIYRVFREGHV